MGQASEHDSSTPFLVTTALEEFWDTSKPILFLGSWCMLYNRRSYWGTLNFKVLDNPFDNDEVAEEAYHYVDSLYERILPIVSIAMNAVHGRNYSTRYWRITLGPWLFTYLTVLYDRFGQLKFALLQYPDCITVGLSPESNVLPSDTLDFMFKLKEDLYNFQIYSNLLKFFGKSFPFKKKKQCKFSSIHCGLTWKKKIKNYISEKYTKFISRMHQSIFLKSSYFPRSAQAFFLLKNSLKILPIIANTNCDYLQLINVNMRKKIQNIQIGDSEFERCLSEMFHSDIPICFLEGFGELNIEVDKKFPIKSKAIFTSNAWYYDEVFKQWAANSAETGTLLLGTPHGGTYGALAIHPNENHESTITNYYYSWGWTRSCVNAQVIPMPPPKLMNSEKIGACNNKSGILWVATFIPRYFVESPYSLKYFNEYLSWQMKFAETLPLELKTKVIFRAHREDPGWGIVQRMNDHFPCIEIDTWDISFEKRLKDCRLYVCDHFSTTFAEALACNKPTILFWNPNANKLRPEAQPYHDLLRENGILFDNPESAALEVNKIYHDVEAWWNNAKRQEAVSEFCKRFARNSSRAVEIWDDEFKRILAMPLNI